MKTSTAKRVIVTTTWYQEGPKDKVRKEAALRTIDEVLAHGYRYAVVDNGSCDSFRSALNRPGIVVEQQKVPGMGPSRRQAFELAMRIGGEEGAYCFIEPEKYPIIKHLEQGFEMVQNGVADFVVLSRTVEGMHSVDRAWEYTSYVGNLAWDFSTGLHNMDVFLGTRVVNYKVAMMHLLTRPGIPGDDSWGTTHYPMLDALKAGLRGAGLLVDYIHPPEQKAVEDNPLFLMKRIKQTRLLVAGNFLYAMQLGLMEKDEALIVACREELK